MNHYQEIITLTVKLGFTTGALMYLCPWFIGYGIHSVLSVFKQLIKK